MIEIIFVLTIAGLLTYFVYATQESIKMLKEIKLLHTENRLMQGNIKEELQEKIQIQSNFLRHDMEQLYLKIEETVDNLIEKKLNTYQELVKVLLVEVGRLRDDTNNLVQLHEQSKRKPLHRKPTEKEEEPC
jgi:hypothetical protein